MEPWRFLRGGGQLPTTFWGFTGHGQKENWWGTGTEMWGTDSRLRLPLCPWPMQVVVSSAAVVGAPRADFRDLSIHYTVLDFQGGCSPLCAAALGSLGTVHDVISPLRSVTDATKHVGLFVTCCPHCLYPSRRECTAFPLNPKLFGHTNGKRQAWKHSPASANLTSLLEETAS